MTSYRRSINKQKCTIIIKRKYTYNYFTEEDNFQNYTNNSTVIGFCNTFATACNNVNVTRSGFHHMTTGVRSPAEAKDFASSLCVQIGSGAHPPSYRIGTEGPIE
jgi:hypothetical protein